MKKFAVLIGSFIIINFALWGAQELYYGEDTKKINEIEASLSAEKLSIDILEAKINLEEKDIEQRENELKNLKSLGYANEYNTKVGDFNYLLSAYKRDLDNYDTKLTSYNTKVNEANTLIGKSGTRWYLIPVPLGGGGKSKL